MPTVTKTFNIPTPIILPINYANEWFKLRHRKTYPTASAWIDDGNVVNLFSLVLDTESIYEIEASHRCLDASVSNPKTITFSTITNATPIYVQKVETLIDDICAVTAGLCRNCTTTYNIKMYFFEDLACTLPLDVTGRGLKIKTQLTINSAAQPEVQSPECTGLFYDMGNLIKYEETCSLGLSNVIQKELYLLNGIGEIVPYIAVGTPAGINGRINVSSGALPVTIAGQNSSGTITAINGSLVTVKVLCTGMDAGAYAVGAINGVAFYATNAAPYTQSVIMPISGSINWNIHLVTTQIGEQATLQLI